MTTAGPTLRVPFPGLRPFDEEDADFFFGQEEQQEALLGRLSASRFVSVIGASGCGKSSLVRAGLIPLLRQERDGDADRWAIAVTHPGTQPLSQLATSLHALALTPGQSLADVTALLARHTLGILDFLKASSFAPNRRLLIFVDQFEELFRFRRGHRDENALNESALYVKILLEAAFEPRSPVYIITTMRSEYLEDCSEFYDLSDAMNGGLFLLPRMTRLQCEEAIVSPIECQEIGIEPSLTQKLLNQTEERTDGLPLLQHALRMVWDKWRADGDPSRSLGLKHFEIDEGDPTAPMVNRLLDVHLDRIYSELKADQPVAEVCFKLLSQWDAKGKETRRTCPAQEVMDVSGAPLAAVQRVVNAFRDESQGRTFLRVMDENWRDREDKQIRPGDVLDLSHECLMRQWGRLREWMKEEYQNSSSLSDLARSAQDGADLSDFATGRFIKWRDEFDPAPLWALRYENQVHPITGKQGVPLKTALEFLKKNERRQEKARGVRWLSAIGAAALLAGLAWYIYRNSASERDAKLARLEAQEANVTAEAAKLEKAKSDSASADAKKEAQAQQAIAQAQKEKADAEEKARKDAEEQSKVSSGLKDRAILAENQATSRLIDLNKINGQLTEANNKLVATEGQLRQRVGELNAATTSLNAANATLSRSNNQKSSLSLVDSARRRADVGQTNEALALLAQALYLDNSSTSASMWIFDLLLRKSPHRAAPPFVHDPIVPSPQAPLLSAAFGPDNRIVTASINGSAQIWDLNGTRIGLPMTQLDTKNPAAINFVEFSADGSHVVTASADNSVAVWDTKGQAPPKVEKFHTKPVLSASFSPDSQSVVTASWDGTAVIWNWTTGKRVPLVHPYPVNFAAFSPDGKFVVTACFDGDARVWDAVTGKAREKSPGVPLRLNHSAIASRPTGGAVNNSGPATGGRSPGLPRKGDLGASLRSARFSPVIGANRIVTASADNTAIVWDWPNGLPVGEALRHSSPVNSAAFSPDGKLVVTASDDSTSRVWDAETGVPLGEPLPHSGHVMSAVFSKDGKRVLTASLDGSARIWEVKIDFDNPTLLVAAAATQSGLDSATMQKLTDSDREKRFKDLAGLAAPGNTSAAVFVRWFLANR